MSDSDVVVASTWLYLGFHAVFYWLTMKSCGVSRRMLLQEPNSKEAPPLRVMRNEELEWLAYIGVLVQLPLALAVALFELRRVAGAQTRLPILYAFLLVTLSLGVAIMSVIHWKKLRTHTEAFAGLDEHS